MSIQKLSTVTPHSQVADMMPRSVEEPKINSCDHAQNSSLLQGLCSETEHPNRSTRLDCEEHDMGFGRHHHKVAACKWEIAWACGIPRQSK